MIKDAGDDPDVTNGAEIVAEVKLIEQQNHKTTVLLHYCATGLAIKGGKGVGVVTKPGLPIPVGEAAINPVPRKMIKEAVMEAIIEQQGSRTAEQQDEKTTAALLRYCATAPLEITISVTNGEKLAKKTLNSKSWHNRRHFHTRDNRHCETNFRRGMDSHYHIVNGCC